MRNNWIRRTDEWFIGRSRWYLNDRTLARQPVCWALQRQAAGIARKINTGTRAPSSKRRSIFQWQRLQSAGTAPTSLSEINRVLAEGNGIGWGSLEAGPTKCTSRKSENRGRKWIDTPKMHENVVLNLKLFL